MNKTDFSRKINPKFTRIVPDERLDKFCLYLGIRIVRLIGNRDHDRIKYVECVKEVKRIRNKLLNISIEKEKDLNPVYRNILFLSENEFTMIADQIYNGDCGPYYLEIMDRILVIWHSLIEVTIEEYIEERKLL